MFRLNEEAWVQAGPAVPQVRQSTDQVMKRWRAGEVAAFLRTKDLEGPAAVLFQNGVAGDDFFTLTTQTLTADLRLSAFAARKVLAARTSFLEEQS